MSEPTRSALSITLSVWRALLLREALTRISGRRAPWLWLLVEPMVHMAFFVTIFAVIGHRVVGGIDSGMWIIIGMLAFFMFRRSAQQGLEGIKANRALFAYRQVRPVDTVIVRAVMEGLLMLIIALVILAIAALLGYTILPDDPLTVFLSMFGLWLVGLAFGLLFSVPNELIPEFGFLVRFMMMPLYLISGVMMPITMVAPQFRQWLLVNPLVHGIESVRLGYANYYHSPGEISLLYLYACATIMLFLGLLLQVRFSERLITQ